MKIISPPFAALLAAAILLGACAPAASQTLVPPLPPTAAAIANPASVYCTDRGGKLEIVTAADGSQTGNCTLPDKTVCEEWAFYRGECGPAKSPDQTAPAYPAQSAAAEQVGKLAIQKLAADLKVEASTIQVTSSEQTTWPDACLGVTNAGEVCAQVLTPGYRLVLTAGGKQYTLHTNSDGTSIRAETK